MAAHDWRILKPGRNCWRLAEAERAAVLIDAADYFRHLQVALLRAQRSIMILGWDFDGRIELCPDRGPEQARPLGPFLRALVEERPELEVRILVWSNAVIHAPGDSMALLVGDAWQQHPRIHLHLDTRHPIYASHHQKIVVVDDSIAFAGGIDLTIRRWDASTHKEEHACRAAPDGTSYEPVHDAQMVVEGEAARTLGELARWRWENALGETLRPVEQPSCCWPDDLKPDFTNTSVAISRTMPAWGNVCPIREVANLVADAIAAAEHTIYIETQYLSSSLVANALANRLSQRAGPEIVLLTTPFSRGFFEHHFFGTNRNRIIRRLSRLPGAHRARFLFPIVPGLDGDCEVKVHTKLLIVDDDLLRVGSGNMSNRSMGLDSECDLAIEATDEAMRESIAGVRSRLVGEHLDVAPELIAEATADKGSLIAAIEALNHNPRALRRFEPGDGPTRLVLGTGIIDPAKPFELLSFVSRKRRRAIGAGH